jgi:protein phosphatase
MKCRFTGLTDTGMVRSVNQDNHYIDVKGRYGIVADGMGGHAGGQEASKIATSSIQGSLDQCWDWPEDSVILLQQALLDANQSIIDDQTEHPERADMGTTAVVVMLREGKLWYAHVGDSRLYLWRDGQLKQVTEDHTWVSRAMRIGDLTPEEARSHPWRHVLSQCLGRKDLREIDVEALDVQPGDRLLLCSDGLTEELPDASIASYFQSDSDDLQRATNLIKAAKEKGGRDNITVLIVEIDADNTDDLPEENLGLENGA